VKLSQGVGWTTIPVVKLRDFSGFRSGLDAELNPIE
jgi:hypothetical protein